MIDYLTTLTTIGKLIAEALKAGGLFSKQRGEKLKQLENEHKKLIGQITKEGEKVERYITFSKLVSQIDRGIAVILNVHTRVADPAQFGTAIESANGDLYATALELRGFQSEVLDVKDAALITAHSEGVVDKIIAANAILGAAGDRKLYIDALKDALLGLGYLKPVGSNVLADIGRQLRGFGG